MRAAVSSTAPAAAREGAHADVAVDRRADLERALAVALPATDEVAVVGAQAGLRALEAGLVGRVQLLVVGAQRCVGDLQARRGRAGHLSVPWLVGGAARGGRATGGGRR